MARTASSYGSAAVITSMDTPQTQNTAPVLEFRCLYTQDLRRKQKRWQDGRLKFHTFNKRVMVYDERSNFVGDAHWREDSEFGEGDELELERGGIRVEVGECVGIRDQDLSELVDKRIKEREERAAAKTSAGASSISPASLVRTQGTPAPHLRPKPLNAMLTPTGHYGRAALPDASPFEERQRVASVRGGDENQRPAKRQRQNDLAPSKNGYAQNLVGATLTLASAKPPSTVNIRYEPVKATPVPQTEPIDLALDDEEEGEEHKTERGVTSKASGPENRPSKIQKIYNKSPPTRGRYASILTGAALTLSRQENIPSQRSGKVRTAESFNPSRQQEPESPPALEDSLLDIELHRSKQMFAKITCKTMNLSKKTSLSHCRSSSPTLPAPVPPISKSAKDSSRNASSFVGTLSREQPISALRIKSRPPRQMMMLMERSNSRLRTLSDSSSRPTLRAPLNTKANRNEVVLSQATMRLSAFCQKQEERLQARLNDKAETKSREEVEDLSPSPEDSGINHQTIDMLLSQTSILAARSESVVKSPPSIPKKTSSPTGAGQVNSPPTNQSPPTKSKTIHTTNLSELASLSPFADNFETSTTLENLEKGGSEATLQRTSRKLLPKSNVVPGPGKALIDGPRASGEEPHIAAAYQPSRSASTGEDLRMEADLARQDKPTRPGRTSLSKTIFSMQNFDLPSLIAGRDAFRTASTRGHDKEEMSKDGASPKAMCRQVGKSNLLSRKFHGTSTQEDNAEGRRKTLQEESGSTEIEDNSHPENINSELVRKDKAVASVSRGAIQEDAMSKNQPLQVSPLPTNPAAMLPRHVNSATQFAKDHFRAIVNSSGRTSVQNQELGSQTPEACVQIFEQPSPPICPANLVSPVNEVAIKPSPKSSPLIKNTPIVGPGAWADVESTLEFDMADIPEAPVPQLASDSAVDPPRLKVINPATRGKSVRTLAAATTAIADGIAPAVNSVAPPPLHTTRRRERVYPRSEEIAGPVSGGPVKGTASMGPWSRESFDLFGPWGPPLKDRPNTSAITS